MTPEEQEQQDNLNAYNQTIGKANNELNKFGKVSNETAAKLSQFQSSLTRDFKALGNSGINLAKQLNNGAIGASVFNDSIGSMSDVIGDLVGMIPYFGTALKTAIKGVSEYTQAVNKQTDALFDSYEQMSKVGAAGAGGIQSVYDNLKKLNLGVNELDKFVAIVGENSDTLRKFGQTVGGGLTEFANVANSLQQGDVGRQFREMGISVDEINNGIASYMKMQTIGGVRQKMSTDQLINASKDYIREVDLLSKVTGQTRKQQEEAMESAMAEERFAAYRTELQLKANMGDKAAAAQLQQVDILNKSLAKEAPKLRIGMLNLMSGTLDNPEAQKIARGLPEVAAKLQKGAFTANDVLNTASKEASRTIGKSGEGFGIGLGKLGIFNDNFGDLNDTVKLANMNEYGTLEERMAAAAAAQKVTDENTKDANKTRDNNRTARDSLNDLINAGIGPVTTAMKGMSTATETTITAMEKMANMMGVETKKRDAAPKAAAPRAPGGRSITPKSSRPSGGGASGGSTPDLSGLPIKGGPDGQATAGGESDQRIIALAHAINDKLGGDLTRFTGFNDRYHHKLDYNSAHKTGHALDFTINDPSKAAEIAEMVRGMPGAKNVKDEYSFPSSKATAGHIHAEVSGYKFGGIATGPESGYETTLHGTEAVVPLPNGNSIPVEMQGNSEQMGLMSAQLSRLDDIVRVMQNQLGVSQKLLQYAQ
jgi:hypothetical protein